MLYGFKLTCQKTQVYDPEMLMFKLTCLHYTLCHETNSIIVGVISAVAVMELLFASAVFGHQTMTTQTERCYGRTMGQPKLIVAVPAVHAYRLSTIAHRGQNDATRRKMGCPAPILR